MPKFDGGSITNEQNETMNILVKPELKFIDLAIGFGSMIFGGIWLVIKSWKSGCLDFCDEEYNVMEKLNLFKD